MERIILFSLAARFLLFDSSLTKNIRRDLLYHNNYLDKLLTCPFCQGFWLSFFIMIVSQYYEGFFTAFLTALSCGYMCLIVTVIIDPIIEKWEENQNK